MAVTLRVRLPRRRRATDARPDRSWPSDARPAQRSPGSSAAPSANAPSPEVERRRRLRRGAIYLFLALVFVGSSLAAVWGEAGLLDLRKARREIVTLEQEVARRHARVAALERHVERLRTDPQAIERIAREDLGLAKPGEITFLLPREEEQEPSLGPGASADPADPADPAPPAEPTPVP
jgi:cell division protein FtsB